MKITKCYIQPLNLDASFDLKSHFIPVKIYIWLIFPYVRLPFSLLINRSDERR